MYNGWGSPVNMFPSANNYPNYGQNYANNLPKMEVIRVNGKNGVDAFQMGANSSALLLDSSAPIVWLVQTDGAGYKTSEPYKISPYQPEPAIDLNNLVSRVSKLEELINAKSNSVENEQ